MGGVRFPSSTGVFVFGPSIDSKLTAALPPVLWNRCLEKKVDSFESSYEEEELLTSLLDLLYFI